PEPIKTGPGRYTSLTWDEKQTKLAFLYDDSAVASPNLAPPPRPAGTPVGTAVPTTTPAAPAKWRAFVWDRGAKPLATVSSRLPVGMGSGFAALLPLALVANGPTVALADEVLGPATPGQRPGWTLPGGSLSFSADGTRLYVNTAPKREPSPAAQAGPPRPDDFTVEVWHWKDDRLQPMQKLQANADQNKTYSAVVHLDTK